MKTSIRCLAGLWIAIVPTLVAQQASSSQTRPTVRYHHAHYLVSDPGAALGPTVEKLNGVRALLPGLGVGVRVGREYVLFDRGKADMRPIGINMSAEALDWLDAQGLAVESREIILPPTDSLPADAGLDHLAFAASELRAVVTRMKDKPVVVTETAARFRLASGSIVEIVRDADRPDAYWCPMHPDVRRPGEAKCPICGMSLVPIPPPRVGEFQMDVAMIPRRRGGAAGLTVTIRDPEQPNEPRGQREQGPRSRLEPLRGSTDQAAIVSTFIDMHERPLHLFIISRDLETFAHVHPERRPDGSFAIAHDLPPGTYGVIADFLPANGTAQLLQRVIVTPGYRGPLFTEPVLTPGPIEQTANGVRVVLDTRDLRARRPSVLRFRVSDASTGQPVRDLEPYLGAAGHLIIVSPDLTTAFHAHPEGALTSGPEVRFEPTFPAPGLYKMWVQFQRKSQVITVPLVMRVP